MPLRRQTRSRVGVQRAICAQKVLRGEDDGERSRGEELRRRFVAERADCALSAGEKLVQRERLERPVNAFHGSRFTAGPPPRAVGGGDVTPRKRSAALVPDPLRARRTEHSLKVLIDGLSAAPPRASITE